MSVLKLVSATTTEERIMNNLKRLELDIWASQNGEVIQDILYLCEDYILGLEENVHTNLALVNLQSTIIILDSYFKL